jgi:hypothetical protein
MHPVPRFLTMTLLLGLVVSLGLAQPPRDEPKKDAPKEGASQTQIDAFVARLMAFDKNKDGKLTKEEITDERLQRLFDRIDVNKKGTITKEDIVAFATKEFANAGSGRPGDRGPGDRGPGDRPGRPGDRGPGDRGPGDRGPGGRPQPGQILPVFLQETLKLSDEQKKQVEALQKEVDAKLEKILTEDQKKQLKELRERGPGRPGDRGPGERGPGDRPPGDRGPGRPGDRPGERP